MIDIDNSEYYKNNNKINDIEETKRQLLEDQKNYNNCIVNKEQQKDTTNKNNNPNDEEKKLEIYSQKYAGSDYLADAIVIGFKPYFAISSKPNNTYEFPSITLRESISLDEKTILKPPSSMSYLNKPYVFISEEEFYQHIENAKQQQYHESIYSIFKEVKSIWKKCIDANDFHISICTADTIFSYLQDKIGLTHYLFFIGNNGSGKSNNLSIFHYLGYRNMMSTDVTAANIFQYLGNLDEGQGTLCEDEADNIDENTDKMRIYKNGYSSGFPVFRTDTTHGRKQYRFFTFCFKAFAAERTPDSIKAKGFNQRIIELHCSPGFPQYDISEVVNPAGEEEHQELLDELMETRKRLLIYRLLHFHDKIPDIKLNIENREKQLFKPIVRVFQNSPEVLDELLPVISNYVSQKRESNADSLHSRLYQIIKRMIENEESAELESNEIWKKVKEDFNGEDIKAQTIQTPDFGPISQKEIIQILKDVFKSKPLKRHGNARSLVFDLTILDKLGKVYDLDINVKVKRKEDSNENDIENGTHQQTSIGLDKHLFDERNIEHGTHGTHGTLSEDRQQYSIPHTSSDSIDYAKSAKNVDNEILDTDTTTTTTTTKNNELTDTFENQQSTTIMEHNTNPDNASSVAVDSGNVNINNNEYDMCSYNASQASQASPTINCNNKMFKCYRCTSEFSTKDEYTRHCLTSHPKQPMYPELSLIKIMGIEPKGNPWET